MKKKILVAYFSKNGENYVNGYIQNLAIGNTEIIVNKLVNQIDCDVLKLVISKQTFLDSMDESQLQKF